MIRCFFTLFLLMTAIFTVPMFGAANPEHESGPTPIHGVKPNRLPAENLREFYPTEPPTLTPRQIAEWEPMEGVLIDFNITYNDFGIPYAMIREMAEDVSVVIQVTNQIQEGYVQSLLTENDVNTANCRFLHAPCEIMWTRDYGPWYIAEGDLQISIVNFRYHMGFYYPFSDDIPIEAADFLDLNLFGMDLWYVGGNYMCDGMGMAVSTDMVYSDNFGMTEAELLQITGEYLGISRYPTFPDPQNTIHHIDCTTKFLAVDKVLVGQVPETDTRYQLYEDVAEYFANAVSSYGTPYEVFRVFTPGTGFGIPPDENPITPYSNSLILNTKIFVPQTGNEWDDNAIAVYEAAMPGYEIIPVYYDMNGYQGFQNIDAVHCRTKGIPDRGMLSIQHIPVSGYLAADESPVFQAEIIPYSSSALTPDETVVNYRLNEGNYQSTPLQEADPENHLFTAEISELGPGTTVQYYLSAGDESGRTAAHPYIGFYDAHEFAVLQIPGDVNNDSALDVLDIVLMVNVIIYHTEIGELPFMAGDLSGDGIINVLDVVQLLNLLIGE